MRWLDSMTDSMDMSLSKLCKIAEDRGPWRAAVHGVTESAATCTTTKDIDSHTWETVLI